MVVEKFLYQWKQWHLSVPVFLLLFLYLPAHGTVFINHNILQQHASYICVIHSDDWNYRILSKLYVQQEDLLNDQGRLTLLVIVLINY